jgi:hypothetical protein
MAARHRQLIFCGEKMEKIFGWLSMRNTSMSPCPELAVYEEKAIKVPQSISSLAPHPSVVVLSL